MMKRNTAICLLIMFVLISIVSNAQPPIEIKSQIEEQEQLKSKAKTVAPKWKTSGTIGITFSQYYFSNWAKGGNNSLAANSILSYDVNYRAVDTSYIWSNNIVMGYGTIYVSELGTRKADDRCEINSKYGYRSIENLYYSALFSFKSQFFKGYNYPNDSVVVSNFLAPAYIIASLGMDYKPVSFLSIYLSPFTGKYIIVNDQRLANQGAYGVKPAIYDVESGEILSLGEKKLLNFGAYFIANFDYNIIENVNLKSKLELFNNYTASVSKDRNKIIVNSENMLNMKVNTFITANVFLNLVYDYQNLVPQYETIENIKTEVGQAPRLQIKENFGLGFSFRF